MTCLDVAETSLARTLITFGTAKKYITTKSKRGPTTKTIERGMLGIKPLVRSAVNAITALNGQHGLQEEKALMRRISRD